MTPTVASSLAELPSKRRRPLRDATAINKKTASTEEKSESHKPNLADHQRKFIVQHISEGLQKGTLLPVALRKLAAQFSVSENTVRRVWNRRDDVSSKIKAKSGRSEKWSREDFLMNLEKLPPHHRQSKRDIARALQPPLATVRATV